MQPPRLPPFLPLPLVPCRPRVLAITARSLVAFVGRASVYVNRETFWRMVCCGPAVPSCGSEFSGRGSARRAHSRRGRTFTPRVRFCVRNINRVNTVPNTPSPPRLHCVRFTWGTSCRQGVPDLTSPPSTDASPWPK